MHQDQRIGLALGVLLVGACAAFFFRNETRTVSNAPRLHHAAELDERIAERSTRPYLKGIEAVEASDRRRTRTIDQGSTWDPLDSTVSKTSRERVPRGQFTDKDSDVQELAPITVPNDHSVLSIPARDQDSTTDRAGRQPDGATGDGRTYVVQKGETLTSIATKMLGHPSRFHELFEANQDQLNDPNDLKLGMTLRIPRPRSESAVKHDSARVRIELEQDVPTAEPASTQTDVATDLAPPNDETNSVPARNPAPLTFPPSERASESSSDLSDEPPSADETDGPKKFIPARRNAPPARPAEPQARANPARETGGRRLTQVLSDSAPGKIAR